LLTAGETSTSQEPDFKTHPRYRYSSLQCQIFTVRYSNQRQRSS